MFRRNLMYPSSVKKSSETSVNTYQTSQKTGYSQLQPWALHLPLSNDSLWEVCIELTTACGNTDMRLNCYSATELLNPEDGWWRGVGEGYFMVVRIKSTLLEGGVGEAAIRILYSVSRQCVLTGRKEGKNSIRKWKNGQIGRKADWKERE